MPDQLKVTIDREACIGSGTCEAMNPAVFQLGDDGIAFVLDTVADADPDELRAIAGSCPSGAILLSEGD